MSYSAHILLVDDNAHNRLALRRVLKGVAAELHEAANGLDALSMSLANDYALILLDVQMPEMDGFEVCELLRADPRTLNTPVIFLTAAYKEVTDKMRGYVAGATDYLAKPIEDHILKAKVQVFLKLYEQRRLLQENNQFLRIAATVFESQEGMMVTDILGNILQVNQAFVRITGFAPEEAVGNNPRMLKSGWHDLPFYVDLWATLAREHYWQGEIWNRRKNGEIYPCWLTISAVLDAANQVTNYVGSFSDITRYKQAEEKIHHLAFYDALTGLPNRRLLMDRTRQSLAKICRNGQLGALIFLDLDNFKMLNDTQGHELGDSLLIEVARRLRDCLREKDSIARLGGDEFVVLIDDLDAKEVKAAAQAAVLASKLLSSLSEPYLLAITAQEDQRAVEYRCTCSLGVTLFPKEKDSVEDMFRRADMAMYQAKDAGRNTIRFFDPAMQKMIQARSELDALLRKSLRNQELELYYQLQVNELKHPVGAEVLLRWHHPQRGLVAPDAFIPLAEENGCIVSIGLWVLETACQQLKRWEQQPPFDELELAVNVSAKQFRQADFVERVVDVVRQTQINPAKLKLELTESVVLDEIKAAIAKMRALKALGVQLSMDDFGTGYSSLSYLQRLPIDELKIDQSFIRNMGSDLDSQNIVNMIIMLAQALSLGMVAEGVETSEQFETLKQKGCSGYQGYWFSKPLPLAQFEALFAAPSPDLA